MVTYVQQKEKGYMSKKPVQLYRIKSRRKNIITIYKWSGNIEKVDVTKLITVNLSGFDCSMLHRQQVVTFQGDICAENLVHDITGEPAKLKAVGCQATDDSLYVVTKRLGSMIHYRIDNSPAIKELTIDMFGYAYRLLSRGVLFRFEGNTASPKNVRYLSICGEYENVPTVKDPLR